jgi:ATP-dependent exoDNAse (exonuclease V) beta subunit
MKMRILSQLYGIWRRLDDSRSYAQKVYHDLRGELSEQQIAERAGKALHLLLHNYSYFRVETIDSFFQSVMRNLARELNLTANLRLGLNDHQVEELAVDQLIDSLSATDQLLQWIMKYIMDSISDDHSWNVIGQVKQFGRNIFRDFYKSRSEELNRVMNQKDFFDRYQQQLYVIKKHARQQMESISDEFFELLKAEGLELNDLKNGTRGVAGLFVKLRRGEFDDGILTKSVLNAVGDPDQWHTKTHPRRDVIHQLADGPMGQLLSRAVSEQPLQWKLYKSADLTLRHLSQLRLLGSIEQKVRQLNDEQNRFLLSDTQQLLHGLIDGSDSPFIFEKIGTQLEHIMIDEFQDTSTVQWKNFKVLLQETMSHKGSENLIVGDVKQSIYRWRSGDWRLLAGIAKEMGTTHGEVRVETLDTNYRSAQRVVSFNNAFFTQAAETEQVSAYDDVSQKLPSGNVNEGYVMVKLLPADDYEQQTLQELSNQVATLISQGMPPQDIAILVRSNDLIPLIANYLNEYMPQLKVVSDEAFRLDASPAVVTIVQALRYLVHPDDAIVRAFLEKSCGGYIGSSLPNDYSSVLLQLPLYELTEQLFDIFKLERMEGQSAYLCAFYDQVAAYTADYGSNIEAFLSEWDESICEKTIQSTESDGLRIISIHKSKGLEFPCVIVPFCSWKLELPSILWCEPREMPFSQLPIAPIDFSQKGMKGTIYEADYEEEHQQNTVDNLNLLYVAFTRAERQLYVYGQRKSAASSRSSLIEQVLPLITPQLQGASLNNQEDDSQPLIFEYGSTQSSQTANRKSQSTTQNPFLQPSQPISLTIETLPAKTAFRQSNKSHEFATPIDNDDANRKLQLEYIQVGNVLHNVLSSIRTNDDIDHALWQMEQDGLLGIQGQLTRHNLSDMLRKRLASPVVAKWFKPGVWQLYNECTILSTDPHTHRVVERRPDRVMTNGHETIVVDFKFGSERKDYHKQVQEYMRLLTQMGLPAVKGYLWLVYSNKIIEVKA